MKLIPLKTHTLLCFQQKITWKKHYVAEYIGLLFYTIHIYNLYSSLYLSTTV